MMRFRNSIMGVIVVLGGVLAGCGGEVAQIPERPEGDAGRPMYIGLSQEMPDRKSIPQTVADKAFVIYESGSVAAPGNVGMSSGSRLARYVDGFAVVSKGRISITDHSGRLSREFHVQVDAWPVNATWSDGARTLAAVFDVSKAGEEAFLLSTLFGDDLKTTSVNAIPEGVTACDDGSVFWLENGRKGEAAVAKKLTADGAAEEVEAHIGAGTVEYATFDCDNGSLTAVVADDTGSAKSVTVDRMAEVGAKPVQEEILSLWISTMPRSHGVAGGAGFSVWRDGTFQRIPLEPDGQVTTGRFDIGDAGIWSMTFDGESIVVVHRRESEHADLEITTFDAVNPPKVRNRVALSGAGEGEDSELGLLVNGSRMVIDPLPISHG